SLFKPVTHGIQLFKEVKELNSQNPSFMVKIRDSDPRKSRPNLSATFYRKYFKKNQQDVKLQFRKESWPTTIIYKTGHRGRRMLVSLKTRGSHGCSSCSQTQLQSLW
ncbi:hypothetical protein S245_072212, partial [Arachis hypogaea]